MGFIGAPNESSIRNIPDDSLVGRHENGSDRTLFGTVTTHQGIVSLVEDDLLEEQVDPLVRVDDADVNSVNDPNRPHCAEDDSLQTADGAVQASVSQLLSLKSVNWAQEIVGYDCVNPSHTLTQVQIETFKLHGQILSIYDFYYFV